MSGAAATAALPLPTDPAAVRWEDPVLAADPVWLETYKMHRRERYRQPLQAPPRQPRPPRPPRPPPAPAFQPESALPADTPHD